MLSSFARRVLAEWRNLDLPTYAAPVIVAVSGGADSTALLLALAELRRAGRVSCEFVIAHLDHGLPGDETYAEWVSELAARHGFEFITQREDVAARAVRTGDNFEQAMRGARYEFFGRSARARGASVVLVAHTLDDQAETVLLRLMRGSGAQGLGGMRVLSFLPETATQNLQDAEARIFVARLLLKWARRAETENYCRERDQDYLRDWINDDERFARVRVRKHLLPLLRLFNPRIEVTLARTADLLRDDAAWLDAAARELLDKAIAEATEETTEQAATEQAATEQATEIDAAKVGAMFVRVSVLASAHPALQRRALRLWIRLARGNLRRVEAIHVKAVQSLLVGERGGRVVEMPGGGRVERRAGKLRYLP